MRHRHGYVATPDGWERLDTRGIGPFVTAETWRRADGSVVHWRSRAHRKLRAYLDSPRGTTWWAPNALGWWIGVLFAIGSACFAVGALPGYASAVGVAADGVTFFIGSLFFTTASFLQYLQAANAPRVATADGTRTRWRVFTYEPNRIDWWATVIQFAGTLFFNATTFHALNTTLTASEANRLVWRPDALGSICFLIASELAFAEVGHRLWSWRPRSRSWQIAALNLGGSVAFGVSTIASFVVPSTDALLSVELTNLGTFVGAIGFLIGGVLLLPERTSPDTDD